MEEVDVLKSTEFSTRSKTGGVKLRTPPVSGENSGTQKEPTRATEGRASHHSMAGGGRFLFEKLILQKLVRANVWGGKHTPLDFVTKGIPEHYRNAHPGRKVVEKVLKDLVNAEWIIILAKRTGKGSDEHVSLNQRKVSEIKQFLENLTDNPQH